MFSFLFFLLLIAAIPVSILLLGNKALIGRYLFTFLSHLIMYKLTLEKEATEDKSISYFLKRYQSTDYLPERVSFLSLARYYSKRVKPDSLEDRVLSEFSEILEIDKEDLAGGTLVKELNVKIENLLHEMM